MIGLLVAIVGVIVYVLITLVPKLTGAQSAPPAEPAAPPPALASASVSTPTGTAAANQQAATTAPLSDDETAAIPAAPAHDSFTPPVGDKSHPPPTPPASQPAPAAKPAASAPNGAGGAAGGGAVAPPAAPALPSIELKGVILGEPAIAVLSVNGEVVQRQMGDQIASGLKLIKIAETGIVLQEGKNQIHVMVGHAMVAATPQPMSTAGGNSQPGKP